jgi:hypothetical protein
MDVLASAALAALDIGRRQRTQRTGDLLNAKIGRVAALSRRQPCIYSTARLCWSHWQTSFSLE